MDVEGTTGGLLARGVEQVGGVAVGSLYELGKHYKASRPKLRVAVGSQGEYLRA